MGTGGLMKNCPACSREVPGNWAVCEYCGNVFSASEQKAEPPVVLFWEGRERRKR